MSETRRARTRRGAALFAWIVPATLALAGPAWAGRGQPCDSCESCTEMLKRPGAEVALSGPIQSGGVCVTVGGAGATFDGSRHPIDAGTAVAIEADDVVVRHLRASGGERVVHVTGDRATLLDAQIADGKVGVLADGAIDLRIVRSVIERVAIGVSFDTVPSTECAADDRLRSPGAVLQRVSISGTGVAIAACEATPAVADSAITGNDVGWVQGAPAPADGVAARSAGPYDPCVCSPTLPDVKPGTTLLYSSGCSGSLFHEGLLPDVRAQGHDINLRQYGRENAAASATYDAYVRRCAPEITDAIGIPGCMPNYACVAGGAVVKRRGDDDRLVVDHRLGSVDEVAQFAAQCVATAETYFADGPCRAPAVRNTSLCHNGADVKAARPLRGLDNRCAGGAELGCSPCEGAPPAPQIPARVAPAAPDEPDRPAAPSAPAAATPVGAPEAAPAPSQVAGDPVPAGEGTAAPEAGAADETPDRKPAAWWFPLIGLPLGAAFGVFLARR